jgi:hypothetical protein
VASGTPSSASGSGGGTYGGGGYSNDTSGGKQGAIRIIWPGNARTFPYMSGR